MQGSVTLRWLGQAGFLIEGGGRRIVVDPYLSDSLAEKYRGREFSHERLMPVPIDPEVMVGIDAVLATHGHSDHLDPGTIPALARANPRVRFIVPASCRELAIERGAPPDRLLTMRSGSTVVIVHAGAAADVTVIALPSAHEQRERDEAGNDRYLGYVIELAGVRVYHSGDCVPFDGLSELVREQRCDAMLLPVNGRDAYRAARGVPGNFSSTEAIELACNAGARFLVAHHFGMFAFNTVDPVALEREFRLYNEQTPRTGTAAIVPRIDEPIVVSAASSG